MENLHASERVVRLQVVTGSFTAKPRDRLIPSLVSSGLKFDIFGIEASELPSNIPKATKVLASPIVVAINDIERAMEKLGYALYCGEVFKKVKSSKYTYQHCCSVKKFLSLLESKDKFKNTIIKQLAEILGDRECEFVRQLRIQYDLIEVKGGWCFSISQRKFVFEPVKDADFGKESPRAYVDYEHTKKPDPGYFKQILENSLNELEMAHFCEYYIRLLNCRLPSRHRKFKGRILCKEKRRRTDAREESTRILQQ